MIDMIKHMLNLADQQRCRQHAGQIVNYVPLKFTTNYLIPPTGEQAQLLEPGALQYLARPDGIWPQLKTARVAGPLRGYL